MNQNQKASPAETPPDQFGLLTLFGGLCLFVRQPAAPVEAARSMQVLMPATDDGAGDDDGHGKPGEEDHDHTDHGGTGDHRHTGKHSFIIAYNDAHESASADLKSGQLTYRDIDNCDVGIVTASNDTFDATVDDRKLVNLAEISRSRLKPEVTSTSLSSLLNGRVTLTKGQAAGCGKGAIWELKGLRELSNATFWAIQQLCGPTLEWSCTGAKSALPKLYPKIYDGVPMPLIIVAFLHLPQDEKPPKPTPKDPPADGYAHHFAAYYELYQDPKETPLPMYECGPGKAKHGPAALNVASSDPHLASILRALGVSVYTCMSGGGGP